MVCLNCNKRFSLLKKGSGGHNRIFCYDCLPISSDRYERNRRRFELITNYSNQLKASKGCEICGYNKCVQALEWHHTGSEKEVDPSRAMSISLPQYLKEVEKCLLLCANCHREIHTIK